MNPADNEAELEASSGHEANPGYALGQLAAALATSESGADPDMRARATEKAKKWLGVLTGMLSGSLRIGSRTPMADVPAWATPEVIKGGFATGALQAGGPLQPHEQALLARLGGDSATPPRARLNHHYLGDAGFPDLLRMLADGHYRVEVPEEGALLAIAWLLGHGHADAAREVLSEIAPHLATLRFYPVPSDAPLPDGSAVHLRTAGETAAELRAVRAPEPVLVQREALLVWAPLADRAVELFLETVEGSAPALRTGEDGRPLCSEAGKYVVEGGWPCQHYPQRWQARALALLQDYRRLRAEHTRSARPDRPRESFAKLRRYLEICVADPARLTGRDVGMIRLLLAMVATRRGLPGSERLTRLRQKQAAVAARPTREELARVVAGRMDALPPDGGLVSLDALLEPVSAQEAAAHGVREGHPLAAFAERRVCRALAAPVEELVELGIISSGESLARVIPAITAQVRAAGLPDADLRRLYGAVYQAFRRRRSLLLLDLQSQVKTSELPWMQALEAQREGGAGTRELSRQALERVATLAVTSFPQHIVPNKLVRELRALADAAELRIPLVDELAADIFMDAFAGTFLRAAQAAGDLLERTLYERYYGISYAQLRAIEDVKRKPYGGAPASDGFFQLCLERSGSEGARWVARNGTIIEQAQVLTTHNLAVLFQALGLGETLRPRLTELASRCLAWICVRLQQPAPYFHNRLHAVKNAAYAWRQMIFYLSLAPENEVRAFLGWAKDHVGQQPADFQARFRPALQGLARAIDGRPVEDADAPDGPRRFLGWTTGGHWLLPGDSHEPEELLPY
jgi:hypothetical protein